MDAATKRAKQRLPEPNLSVNQAVRDLAITRQTLRRIPAGEASITLDTAATAFERYHRANQGT